MASDACGDAGGEGRGAAEVLEVWGRGCHEVPPWGEVQASDASGGMFHCHSSASSLLCTTTVRTRSASLAPKKGTFRTAFQYQTWVQ
ncbi:MAG: hypothetical protein COV59_04785 [Candidatus Magasanikbacteria bacterium CG11_big_fil_rev_8_21_14_0_20_39_34]|uniref:Uncharacterized protein n=1 Tax=Candidatus Magasanikbacteria bacterium CG11_big_fil_rev_8_21_14_0_20_39_34 TaxID=1974653 RepID=A0A2H0N4D4_9BACT|nr:MAG: hypothetical protein COV59_04785 [Candidatus Magasanikbacteria bacterium CG11_big_fil_rev_8_21_14_0_20_39_34]